MVDRAWPFFLGGYFLFAAVYNYRDGVDDSITLYAFTSAHVFVGTLYWIAVATCAVTTIVPALRWPRLAFFTMAGFALTGRLVSHAFVESSSALLALGRVGLFSAMLAAHFVMQVDWQIEHDGHVR